MHIQGRLWILFDLRTRKQTKPLSALRAQAEVLKISAANYSRYLIWTPGWHEWIALPQFLNSSQTYFVLAPEPVSATVAAAPFVHIAMGDVTVSTAIPDDTRFTRIVRGEPLREVNRFYDEFSAEQIDPEAVPVRMHLPLTRTADRRRADRHLFKIEVILINKQGRAFRTTSKKISLGGTLLEEDPPKEFSNAHFDLILVNRFEKDPLRGRLHFRGKVIGDFANPRRLMFMETDQGTLKNLKSMLKSYLLALRENSR